MRKRRFCGNRALYRRLLLDKDYVDVRFDVLSGGVSAIHKYHRFDQQSGPYGIKRGEYEKLAVNTLRRKGHVVILGSEREKPGVKMPDGTLDGLVMDIKAIESDGRWTIKKKMHAATKQGAKVLVLYFLNPVLYSRDRIESGWTSFSGDLDSQRYPQTLRRVVFVVGNKVEIWEIKKPPW